MAQVVIYTKDYCPYCVRAKALFDILQQPYTEIDLSQQPNRLEEMLQLSGGSRTVPQIFINSQHIGGCDDLMALHHAGKLTPLLAK